jgi:uncharacterized protein YndB with AHSA1/START domain
MSSASSTAIPPVRKQLHLARPVAEVFEAFTVGMGKWWPLRTHSVCGHSALDVVFEDRLGGRVFEKATDGSEHDWGRVTWWDPPRRFEMTWHPGREAATGQRLIVEFAPEGDGTRLDLLHLGWEQLGDRGTEAQIGYETGWDAVLSALEKLCAGR